MESDEERKTATQWCTPEAAKKRGEWGPPENFNPPRRYFFPISSFLFQVPSARGAETVGHRSSSELWVLVWVEATVEELRDNRDIPLCTTFLFLTILAGAVLWTRWYDEQKHLRSVLRSCVKKTKPVTAGAFRRWVCVFPASSVSSGNGCCVFPVGTAYIYWKLVNLILKWIPPPTAAACRRPTAQLRPPLATSWWWQWWCFIFLIILVFW